MQLININRIDQQLIEISRAIQQKREIIQDLQEKIYELNQVEKKLNIYEKMKTIRNAFRKNLKYKDIEIDMSRDEIKYQNNIVYRSKDRNLRKLVLGDWIQQFNAFYKLALLILKKQELEKLDKEIEEIKQQWELE